jgi:hypothetical protein
VHAEHLHRSSVVVSDRADAHERRHDRDAEVRRERAQLVGRLAVDDAAAGVDERAVRRAQQLVERLAVGGRRSPSARASSRRSR